MNELAQKVAAALKAKGLRLATAESCTGGWVAMALTAVPGSSDWFERGYVTYSNAAKQEDLGVAAKTLRAQGAVSEAVAREMAAGAQKRAGAQVALAITGVAGPTGGTKDKPVGMVCFAWAHGSKIRSETKRFDGDRESVRRQSVIHALERVMEAL
ncbi:MAG: CinA family protein [Betaproteobacteria bacterium]|nr:CinA family protein [Betaproteobacteria bacterium]MDH5577561.1 CinA family protein [Betaproteobacteria bacterium]